MTRRTLAWCGARSHRCCGLNSISVRNAPQLNPRKDGAHGAFVHPRAYKAGRLGHARGVHFSAECLRGPLRGRQQTRLFKWPGLLSFDAFGGMDALSYRVSDLNPRRAVTHAAGFSPMNDKCGRIICGNTHDNWLCRENGRFYCSKCKSHMTGLGYHFTNPANRRTPIPNRPN